MNQEDTGSSTQDETAVDQMSPAERDAAELASLKKRATTMGITFSNNIGLAALRERVNGKIEAAKDPGDELVEDEAPAEPTQRPETVEELEARLSEMKRIAAGEEADSIVKSDQLNPLAGDKIGQVAAAKMTVRQKAIRDAMALIRCRITCLDPKKKDLPGEILCIGNRYIGTVKKFIPYGEVTDGGYHIPKVLYDELESRRFLHIQTSRDRQNGQIKVKTSYAKEFSIEVLPMLTPEELAKLAAAQLAASNA